MKIGDVVSVILIRQFVGTERLPAIVTNVGQSDPYAFVVKLINGVTFADGSDSMFLNMHDMGRTWEP